MTMADELLNPPRRVRGRPFEKGRSGNPAGRRRGSRNRATLAAVVLLEGESEALTRKAVELALAGDPVALRLCIERILPICCERAVRLALPPIEGASDVSAAASAVTSALARGALTPGEAERIAIVVETFARAIDTTRRREFAANPMIVIRANLMTAITRMLMSMTPSERDAIAGLSGKWEEPVLFRRSRGSGSPGISYLPWAPPPGGRALPAVPGIAGATVQELVLLG
jgi:hypothetical protein